METVVSSNGISKTVEAEKEVFLCTYKQNKPTQIRVLCEIPDVLAHVSRVDLYGFARAVGRGE